MNVEEARAEFILTMEDACIESCEHDSKDGWEHNITIAADAYALAVLDEADALSQYTCHAACDHHEDYCLTTQRSMLRRRIEALR